MDTPAPAEGQLPVPKALTVCMQEYVQREHHDADGVLPIVIYSDETHVSRSRNVHVLLVFIALPLHIMRADGGLFRYLAFPPSFKARDVGLPNKSQKKEYEPTPSWQSALWTPSQLTRAAVFHG